MRAKLTTRPWIPIILGAVLLLGCNRPGGVAEEGESPTRPAGGNLTSTSASVSPTPTRGSAAGCGDDAEFIEDLTVPDGTVVDPGEIVDKRWSVRNTGSCDWGPDYRLAPAGDNPLAGPGEVALYPARAGAQAIWRVNLEAPANPGEYIGTWQAVNPSGEPFGDTVFVVIEVDESGALPTESP